MTSCDRDRIYAFVEDPLSTSPEIEIHLEECASCMELYGSLQELTMALSDPEAWSNEEPQLAEAIPTPSLDRLVGTSIRLREEGERGAALVARMASEPLSQWHRMLRELAGVCTVGLARALLGEARSRIFTTPTEAVEIADLAIEVTEALDPNDYEAGVVHQARGLAWKDRANALRFTGQVQDALWSLDEAVRHFARQPVPDFDLATVDYVRATVLAETDHLEQAVNSARRASEVFMDYGDTRRQNHSLLAEANALGAMGRKREARETYMALLKPTQQMGDSVTLAMLFLNIANCSVDLEDVDTASIYFLQASALCDEMGLQTEAIRARWGLGRLLLSQGKCEEAVERLRRAERDYREKGMAGEAAIISLEMIEALAVLERFEEVQLRCRELIDRFTREGVSRRAIAALAFLREAAEARKATPVIVQHVRKYMEQLPKDPELLFLPPPV